MERLVANRLVWYLEKNSVLTNVQTGFRKSLSTEKSVAIPVTDSKETANLTVNGSRIRYVVTECKKT